MTHTVEAIYTHTEGEPTCIVHAGIPWPRGNILAKRRFIEVEYDWLRRALMQEPRGHKDMFGVFVAPPHHPAADAGMIWMDGRGYMHMCGHGTIGLTAAMVAERWVKSESDRATILLESTAGTISAEVGIDGGRAAWCRFENVPAFVAEQDVAVELPGYGTYWPPSSNCATRRRVTLASSMSSPFGTNRRVPRHAIAAFTCLPTVSSIARQGGPEPAR
jgi:proline racemase